MKITAQEVMTRGRNAIADRAKKRDSDGEKSFARAARIFNAITGHNMTEYEVTVFLASVKWARAHGGEFHEDDYIDAASYTALACEARSAEVWPTRRDLPKVQEDGESIADAAVRLAKPREGLSGLDMLDLSHGET